MAKNKPFAGANGLFSAISITFLSYYLFSFAFFSRSAASTTSGVSGSILFGSDKKQPVCIGKQHDIIVKNTCWSKYMEKLQNFLKKNARKILKFLAFLLLSLLIVCFIILITYSYFTNTSGSIYADKISTDGALEKKDWLAFWGSVLTVISTTLLAVLTIRQNKVLNDINQEHENKDSHFLKLRFAAEFHSLIDFTAISFFRNGQKKRSVMVIFNSIGRVAPSEIRILKMSILHGWRKNSNKIDGHEILTLENIELGIITRTEKDEKGKYDIVFEINESSYKKLFKTTKSINAKKEPSLRLIIDAILINPINVTTRFAGEVSFSHEVHCEESKSNKEGKDDSLFNVCGSFLKTISFDFHDTLVDNEGIIQK